MHKPSPDSLAAQLKQQQAALALTVDQLKGQLAPAALAAAGRAKLAQAAKSAAVEPTGRPKPWVLIALAAATALLAAGLVARLARRRK
ncbi:MAG: hypothetical protein LBD51_04120 [Bifidobacteriaceae bacterium]|jgi:hypothetical protein|nr:hypothetical protein [Bifidobacteriaceae bacterium]